MPRKYEKMNAVRSVSRQTLKKVISGNMPSMTPAVVVDVREKEEVTMGMIPTAVHVPLSTVADTFKQSPTNLAATLGLSDDDVDPLDVHLIFYCRSGARSGVVRSLHNLRKIYHCQRRKRLFHVCRRPTLSWNWVEKMSTTTTASLRATTIFTSPQH